MYKENHKEKRAVYSKMYNTKNKDKISLYLKEWTKNNKDLYREYVLKRRYKITMDEFNEIVKAQNGYCYICGRHESEFKRRLHLDHCHKTGNIRKLLCIRCNNGLGFLDDDIEKLHKCIKYLEDHK